MLMFEPRVMPRAMAMTQTAARQFTIAVLAFLTVVDLFAAQALASRSVADLWRRCSRHGDGRQRQHARHGDRQHLLVAKFGRSIDRRHGVTLSLALLAVPTALLALAPDLLTFALLRVTQGLLMSAAFALTLAHLAETTGGATTSAAFAAYITGNVASNLLGRLIAASVADVSGPAFGVHCVRSAQSRGRRARGVGFAPAVDNPRRDASQTSFQRRRCAAPSHSPNSEPRSPSASASCSPSSARLAT